MKVLCEGEGETNLDKLVYNNNNNSNSNNNNNNNNEEEEEVDGNFEMEDQCEN